MDGQNRPPLNVEDLDRALADALRIEPSSDFRSHVRDRVTREPMRPRWVAAVPLALAASLVIASAFVLSRDAVNEPPAEQIATAQDVMLAPITPPMTTKPQGMVRSGPHRAVAAPRLPVGVSQPEVLLSASEQAGVRLLFESVASGRLELPPEMLRELSLPLADFENTEGDNQ